METTAFSICLTDAIRPGVVVYLREGIVVGMHIAAKAIGEPNLADMVCASRADFPEGPSAVRRWVEEARARERASGQPLP